MPTAVADAPAPLAALKQDAAPHTLAGSAFLAALRRVGEIIRRHPEWAMIVAAWFVAGLLPAWWYMSMEQWWSETDSPLFFQPFVPLFCAALLYHERDRLASAWRHTPKNRRVGSILPVWIGAVLIGCAHFVHVLTVAALGLWIVAVGVVYFAYGWEVVKEARRALLFGLLMLPPPLLPLTRATSMIATAIFKLVCRTIQHMGKQCSITVTSNQVAFDIAGRETLIHNRQITALLFTGFLLLFWSLWRRRRLGETLINMGIGALVTLALATVIPFVVFLLPENPASDIMVHLHPLFLTVASVAGAVWIEVSYSIWYKAFLKRTQVLGKASQEAQKATERATDALIGGRTGRALGKSLTRGTEAALDRIIAAIAKPFKRRRDR